MLIIMGTVAAYSAEQSVCPEGCTISGTISSITTAIDKNGQPYTRLITTFNRSLHGYDYTVDLPVMAFDQNAEPAAALQQGEPLKAIVQNRNFEGRESYTIIRLID